MKDTTAPTGAFWMPFTPNRAFKAAPRLVVRAEGVRYHTPDGREVLDGTSGLWCVGAGHRHPRIAEAMKRQIDTLDFASNFQVGHPGAFALAGAPGDTLVPAPPFTSTAHDVDRMVDLLRAAIQDTQGAPA